MTASSGAAPPELPPTEPAERDPSGELDPLRRAVLDWAPEGWRELPWRRTRDPWAVLVSELMLQQTQVARVVPRWREFMARWPTPASCAVEAPAEVVRAWAGLGYNRRALNVHRSAVAIVERHGGEMPSDLAALLALPGIGPYTARAVLAFAFGRDVGVLDTNAGRVVARAAAGRPLPRPEAQRLADALVPAGQGWAWNQAVLDLGATVCTARSPACRRCPLETTCRWRRHGGPDPAIGSAGSSGRQSAFEGSHRQGRGRLLAALRAGPVEAAGLATACGWPGEADRAAGVAAGLVDDGFARLTGGGRLELA
jgi:A/G-specific adenine glycosylase